MHKASLSLQYCGIISAQGFVMTELSDTFSSTHITWWGILRPSAERMVHRTGDIDLGICLELVVVRTFSEAAL